MDTTKKFIITDPCYILEEAQYRAIGESLGWGNFTNMKVPSIYKERGNKGNVTIHRIKGTPHGFPGILKQF